ncbi:hypothetical protein WA026_004212 [Henosepilachna vigintioctopunctata]|uniref:Inositol polyphosphate 1-phosphatase n=1 Tax=Henosepilachna vigintioctopunctata TaxID=420089 RepID=A0AAW1U8V1_9CUCU
MEFLEALLKVSEKAANVARTIRREERLFELLVQRKDVAEANPRFVDDFKTLADVLIQEMVKHDLKSQFPDLESRIRGEESNVFCNTLGEKITVEIKESQEDTADLLATVLNGNNDAAVLLAEEVHKSVSLEEINTIRCPEYFSLDIDRLGIWIDPIDSTSEYIRAVDKDQNDVKISGLTCVTILIGAYDLHSGEPVIGVVNQPFLEHTDEKWRGGCYWGVCANSTKISSVERHVGRTNTACLSASEDEEVKWKLKRRGYKFIEASGAGYKILTVIKGQADCYILSKSSTFKWDTCGPQAILRSLGGDIVDYKEAVKNNVVSIKYPQHSEEESGSNCNVGGLIAFQDPEVLEDFIEYSV